jgi:hypothetical protein
VKALIRGQREDASRIMQAAAVFLEKRKRLTHLQKSIILIIAF